MEYENGVDLYCGLKVTVSGTVRAFSESVFCDFNDSLIVMVFI